MSRVDGVRRGAFWTALIGLLAVAAFALPASAAAAPCPVAPGTDATAWIGGSGSFNNDANWTNGGPSGSCDTIVQPTGSPTITMTGGASMRSLTLGGLGSTPTLIISVEGPNTNLNATTTGIDIADGASIVLTCPAAIPASCLGDPNGGAGLNAGSSTINNEGTITVDANSGTGAIITGNLDNFGTIEIDQTASHFNGLLLNQGDVNIADGKIFKSVTEHCGNPGTVFRNETGGTLDAEGTGTLNARNFEQGNGVSTGANPVQLECGTLKYIGNGAGKVRAYGGFTLTGEMVAGQTLTVSAESSNTHATLGGDFTNGGSIALTCPPPPGECSGGAGGGSVFNGNGKTFTNAGTLTVAADSGTGARVESGSGGTIVNTGTMQFDQSAGLSGIVVNKGAIGIADGKTALNQGSSCGDMGAQFKNDSGGSVSGTGSGRLVVYHYEQGNGTTSGDAPVQIVCGSVNYTGSGASKVVANGGFSLAGEMQPGQELVINETTGTLNASFTSKGSIVLTCLTSGCGGGANSGATLNAASSVFTNAGTLTIAAASGAGSSLNGSITNTGTIQFNQDSFFRGVVTNQGEIVVADGKRAISPTEHCGNPTARVINDTGGEIVGIGSGTVEAANFEQGAGTTSGTAPVSVHCGALKYIGGGASTIRVISSASLTGNIGAGQTLNVPGVLHGGSSFANAGTITLEGGSVNVGTLTNTGLLTGIGTVNGSLDNTSGTVAPGASPGTLTINNAYSQGAGGSLEIEVEGTGAGQFDKLAVGGDVTLGGTLAMKPSAAYAAAAAVGDSLGALTYGGSRTAVFAQTTSTPALACPKLFGAAYNDGPKNVSAVVSGSGSCPLPPENPPQQPDNPQRPTDQGPTSPDETGFGPIMETTLKSHPAATVKTRKAKAKVSFTFSSNPAAASFQCKLDNQAYQPCSSPKSYKVKPGKHKFSVRAVRADGVADPSPAEFSFKVKKLPKKK